jgi:glycosyltransferase involved in cell wall biosynthesis
MRVLLVAYHRYPAFEERGSGRQPAEYPSGSGYHLHDLLARGLAEEGHEVFYQLSRGSSQPMPPGVALVSEPPPFVDICHGIFVGSRADETLSFAAAHGKPCLLTCHLDLRNRGVDPGAAAPNWVFVSRTTAQAHGSKRFVLNGLSPSDYIYSESKDEYFLFIANMDRAREKGLDVALALSLRKGFRLIVAGTSTRHETIRHIAECCEDSDAEYVGDLRGRAKAELLAGAQAVLFPSRTFESCPLVIIEAMMSGTPVISSATGGSPELVSPEVGFLCDQTEEWDRAVDRVKEIAPKRCREEAVEKYHYRRMALDYLREYEIEIAATGG